MSEYITKDEAKELIENYHVCYQADKIIQMHKVLLGNGEPEKSLVSQVLLSNARQEQIITVLNEIKEKRKSVFPTILNVIGAISAIALMYYGYKDLSKKTDETLTETKVTNEILAPAVTRGGVHYDTIK